MKLRTKFGMIVAIPAFLVLVVGTFIVSTTIWISRRFLYYTGILEALNYLIKETYKKLDNIKIERGIK